MRPVSATSSGVSAAGSISSGPPGLMKNMAKLPDSNPHKQAYLEQQRALIAQQQSAVLQQQLLASQQQNAQLTAQLYAAQQTGQQQNAIGAAIGSLGQTLKDFITQLQYSGTTGTPTTPASIAIGEPNPAASVMPADAVKPEPPLMATLDGSKFNLLA